MNRIIRTIAIAAVSAATISATAQETPRWIRKNAISPDGTKVAFCYQGDIFTVSSEGGRALQVTSSPAYDSDPFWTPDGKSLVFSSTRLGSRDIFITSAEGGTPKRITDYPGNEVPMAVLDGGKVIFSADIQQDTAYAGFPENAQLWQIGIEGGRPLPVTSLPVSSISINKDGEAIYEDYKGYEDALRKHHTSSVTRDIWLFKPSDAAKDRFRMGGNDSFTKLSSFIGEDRNPVFAPDGKSFYFISERSGTLNVHKASTTVPGEDIQVTSFKENPVRHLSVSGNGILCFSWNGDLYTMKEGAEPVRLDITLARDNDEKEVEFLNLANASSMAVSPSGKEIAVVIRGDVFVTSEEFKTTNRITNTPEQERNVCFSKDGRTLYYSSERNGHWGIWASTLSNKEDKCFTYAKAFDEKLVTTEGETCFQPIVSPDGKWIAFLRNRTELVIRDLKDGKEKSLLKDVNYSYSDGDLRFQWSPDSKYLLTDYMGEGRWNNCDIALIDIESGRLTDLTLSGYSDGNFKWALDGYAMVWESDKNGYRSHGSWGSEGDVYIMFFDSRKMAEFYRSKEDNAIAKMMEESGDKSPKQAEKEARKEQKDSVRQAEKPAKLVLDLEGREYRTRRLTGISSRLGDFHLTKDGEKLFYVSQLEKTSDLCMLDIKTGDVKVVKKGVRGSITPSADGKNLYILSGGSIMKIPASGGGAPTPILFSGEYEFKSSAERSYIFDHVWKQVDEKFYDPQIHGVDWKGFKDNYRQFLPYIKNQFDFQDLLSEMLGELNGSHTGARAYFTPSIRMGWVGALFDHEYQGAGLKIAEILPGGPLDLTGEGVKAGDVIVAVNGKEVKEGESWFPLLMNTVGKRTSLLVRGNGRKGEEREIFVKPVSSERSLMYKRWVKRCERITAEVSDGRIGYTHVQGMDSPSFREVYSTLLGRYRTADAAVVDTRNNGGGWLHDDLVTFLGGKEYIRFTPRGQYVGLEPFSKWTKPSCVLVCENNYSDASGFPYAYRTLGLGKLVGMPVPGTMTAVWWETQINGMVFGIPQVGSWAVKEDRYLENMQLEPDVRVENDPASLLSGKDRQLEAAVRLLME